MATKSVTVEIHAREAEKYRAGIDEYLRKIDQTLERIDRTHAAIEKKKAATRAIRERFKVSR
mgnify:CR=1 FL=1